MAVSKTTVALPDPEQLAAVLKVLMLHSVTEATIGGVSVKFAPYSIREKARNE